MATQEKGWMHQKRTDEHWLKWEKCYYETGEVRVWGVNTLQLHGPFPVIPITTQLSRKWQKGALIGLNHCDQLKVMIKGGGRQPKTELSCNNLLTRALYSVLRIQPSWRRTWPAAGGRGSNAFLVSFRNKNQVHFQTQSLRGVLPLNANCSLTVSISCDKMDIYNEWTYIPSTRPDRHKYRSLCQEHRRNTQKKTIHINLCESVLKNDAALLSSLLNY